MSKEDEQEIIASVLRRAYVAGKYQDETYRMWDDVDWLYKALFPEE